MTITVHGETVGQYSTSVRWNRYLSAPVVDIYHRSDEVLSGQPLRLGTRSVGFGIMANVTIANPTRYPGDLQNATVQFFAGCGS